MTITDRALASADTSAANPNSDGQWTTVCTRDQLEPLWGEAALVDGAQVALFLMPDGRLFAVSNADPATGAQLMSRGIVGSKAGRPTIASPLHKDVFDLDSGLCYTKPTLRLPTWRVREYDGFVQVAPRPALVAASHGTSDPAGQRAVAGLVAAVRAANPGLSVLDSFVDVQSPDVPETMAGLPPQVPVAIVPLLLSAGYHVHVDLADAARAAAPREVQVSGALGPDRRLAAVLARRLYEAGLDSGDRVVLAAAGSSNASAVADCHTMGALLAEELAMPVTVSFISAAEPRVPAAVSDQRAEHPGARVIVATYLLAPGYFANLAADAGADVTSGPLLLDGVEPPSELVDIVAELYASVAVTANH